MTEILLVIFLSPFVFAAGYGVVRAWRSERG